MPEPVNPYRREAAPPMPAGLESMTRLGWARDPREDAWDECYEAWRAWLASDEAVERVARAMVDQLPGGPWRWQLTTADLGKARAVLAALRGDGDV